MIKITLWLILSVSIIYAVVIPSGNSIGNSVVPGDKTYYKHTQDNIEIIYTEDNAKFANHVSKLEPSIHKEYENFYDWTLDEKLSVGLISDNNQIANGFSTQFPNNRQINYLGGTSYVDYFTTISWLDTLLYHESAHNYQLNVKGSAFSRTIHSVLGNGSFLFPTFTIPNLAENSFTLEGNAVLNESWHGNGGRLYSGRLYAQTILQAKAGNIEACEVYNSKVEFPYGEIYYIQGGFYNLYMAENYGLKQINSYFKYNSRYWFWPFLTNRSMKIATGINFEDSLNNFARQYAKVDLVKAEGELLASSQFFTSLNSDAKEIYFLTNESGRRSPELVVVNKNDFSVSKQRASWSAGKVIKNEGIYYTQASANTSPTRIIQGLYDANRFIKDGTESKMIQGYTSDTKEIYFDVPSSYSQPQLYVGDEFYAQVNSSVFIDAKDNLYYFTQKDKTRTLYKNKKALFSLQGYYAIVSDVDSSGAIYFIANSKNGSTLYMFKDKKVTRVSEADNIVEARLINDSEVLLAAMSDKDYYYVKTELKTIKETPFEVKLFFEDKAYFASTKEIDKPKEELPNLSNEYNSLFDMRYSGTDFSFLGSTNNITGTLNVKFADPLTQNATNFFISRDDANVTIAGAGYESALFRVNYGAYAYGVVENTQVDSTGNTVDVRDYGLIAYASLPLYKAGYLQSSLTTSYYQDADTLSREPLSLELSLSKYEQYGVSMFSNYKNYLSAYLAQDRENNILGVKYSFMHDLPYEFYISLDAKYSASFDDISSVAAKTQERGVKMSKFSFSSDLDPSSIDMASIDKNIYVKEASYLDVGLKKVFNLSSYWFTFPISLQREVVYTNYRYFTVNDFSNTKYNIAEFTLGISASFVFLNSLSIPIGIEYIYNNTFFAKDTNQLFFTIGRSF